MKGLMFKPDLILATIEDRKNVTRRLAGLEKVKVDRWDVSTYGGEYTHALNGAFQFINANNLVACRPRYLPGETVYLKEGLVRDCQYADYKLDNKPVGNYRWRWQKDWLSPLHLPEDAARYHVKIVSVRPERVQEITPEECRKEGVTLSQPEHYYAPYQYYEGVGDPIGHAYVRTFHSLWNSINAKPKPVKVEGVLDHYVSYPWESGTRTETYRGKPHYIRGNAWVWRIEYERVG